MCSRILYSYVGNNGTKNNVSLYIYIYSTYMVIFVRYIEVQDL